MSREDFGVPELLLAADVLEYRCSGACLEHIDTACVRWVDLIPQRTLHRPTDLTFLNDEGEHLLVAGEAHD